MRLVNQGRWYRRASASPMDFDISFFLNPKIKISTKTKSYFVVSTVLVLRINYALI